MTELESFNENKKKRTKTGLWITGIYTSAILIYSICISCKKIYQLPLNELGDFLAGALSPLAFLWFIIGYFQQGEELNQNTRELSEIKEQHKNMVALEVEKLKISKSNALRNIEITATFDKKNRFADCTLKSKEGSFSNIKIIGNQDELKFGQPMKNNGGGYSPQNEFSLSTLIKGTPIHVRIFPSNVKYKLSNPFELYLTFINQLGDSFETTYFVFKQP